MSHSDNIKFPWAFSGAAKIRSVDWICLPDKSYVFKSLLYVLFAAKLLLYGRQGDKQLGWGSVPQCHMFYRRDTVQYNIAQGDQNRTICIYRRN